jgi:hypothetical protein
MVEIKPPLFVTCNKCRRIIMGKEILGKIFLEKKFQRKKYGKVHMSQMP